MKGDIESINNMRKPLISNEFSPKFNGVPTTACQYLTLITQNVQYRRIPYLVVLPAVKKLKISFQINYISHGVNALWCMEISQVFGLIRTLQIYYFGACSGSQFSFVQGCSLVSPWHSLICSGVQFSGLSINLMGCWQQFSHISASSDLYFRIWDLV